MVVRLSTVFLAKRLTDFVMIRSMRPARASSTILLNPLRFVVEVALIPSSVCEMVTPILTYADMETLQELIRQLRHAGAKSDASRGCGVHYASSRIIGKILT